MDGVVLVVKSGDTTEDELNEAIDAVRRAGGNLCGTVLNDLNMKSVTEAFDNKSICRTKYSLSTKIAESLRSGACILAYGPSEIAAIDYLRRYRAAYILEKAEELPNAIRHLCEEANEYSHYTLCAQSLAEQFHSAEVNEECLRDIFVEAISNYKTAEVKECKTTK